jgi:hypothetical protein
MVGTTILFSLLMGLYFGAIKHLKNKNVAKGLKSKSKEFFLFILLYAGAFIFLECCWNFYLSYQYQEPPTRPVLSALLVAFGYHFSPFFVVAYLIYPFKTIKRSKIVIWTFSIISILVLGITLLLEIIVGLSSM